MRHHTAAALADGSGFHYASVSKRGGYPLGDCRDHAPHSTEGEARACYRAWQRAHVVLDVRLSSWSDCHVKGCESPAKTGARIDDGDGYNMAVLCEDHLTNEHAITALGLDGEFAGDSWVS